MLTTSPNRMFRNRKFRMCQGGHDWAYIQFTDKKKMEVVKLNRGVRICKKCKRQKRINNWIATMKARERRNQ